MGNIFLYTGGARSGKSSFAQKNAQSYENVAYVATAEKTDVEMERRIKKHRADRPDSWKTYECPYDIISGIENTEHDVFLIDCITVYISNLIFKKTSKVPGDVLSKSLQGEAENYVSEKVSQLISFMQESAADFILVTNEVGMSVVPANPLSRLFRDIAGFANQALASAAQNVFVAISGIPLQIKGNK